MVKKITLFLLSILSSIALLSAQDIPEKPSSPRMVNDFAGILNGNTSGLEAKLRAYNDSTSTQIVVVTVQSLNGYELADFSQKLAEKWGIGQKGKNNGLLILVAVAERKTRIEVGYGLEAFVPDAKAKWIITNIITPAFKQKDFIGGIDGAVNEIMDKASGAYTRDGSETDKLSKNKASNWIIFILVLGFIGYRMFRNRPNGYSSYSSGGTIFGGGGFSSGGGSSGGSDFGGFGGGSFGGGGASGDW